LNAEQEASAVEWTVAGFSLLALKYGAGPQTGFKLWERHLGDLVSLGRSGLLNLISYTPES
jgi:hypothetical protein